MAASDTKAAWTAGCGVTVVAVTAAVISFEHVRTLALRAGERELTSWLLPVSIDGAIAAAVAVLLADSRAGRRSAALAWLLLAMGLASSLAANVASAHPSTTARAVAAWPPLALALGIEVLAGLVRRSGTQDAAAGAMERAGAASPATSVHRQLAAVSTASNPQTSTGSTVQATRRHAGRQNETRDAAAIELIRELDGASGDRKASRLAIQKALGCGGSRAARLAQLARAPERSRAQA